MPYKVGDDYLVWWNTHREKVGNYYPARIIGIRPYTGKYKNDFNYIFKLEAPTTKNGWSEMTVKEDVVLFPKTMTEHLIHMLCKMYNEEYDALKQKFINEGWEVQENDKS